MVRLGTFWSGLACSGLLCSVLLWFGVSCFALLPCWLRCSNAGFFLGCLRFHASKSPHFASLSTLSSLHYPLYTPLSTFSSLATLSLPLSVSNSDCCLSLSLSFSVGSRLSVVLSSFPTSLPISLKPLHLPPPSGTVHNPCENLKRFIYFLPLPFAVAIAAQHSDACSGAAAAAAPMSHRAAFPANALQQQILAYRH